MQTGNDTSGATARSQGAPQARTPRRVLEDLVKFTLFHDLQIQKLNGGYRILWLHGYMYRIDQYFINEVKKRGWDILEITAGPQGTLEVMLWVEIAPDNTPTIQPNERKGGVGGDERSDGA